MNEPDFLAGKIKKIQEMVEKNITMQKEVILGVGFQEISTEV